MAKGDKDEHRMLFDIRGKRRNVVKVVYAILAVLMGLSLVLLAGPGLFGNNNGNTSDPSQAFEDQAQRVEAKLRKDPQNPDLLLNLARTRVNAGNSLNEVNQATGEIGYTVEGRQQFEKASAAWSEYLEATDEPTAGGAQLMSNTLFALAQLSRSGREAETNVKAATEAQQIVADQRPSVGSLSTLALYRLFTFDYKGAEEVNAEAEKLATSKFQKQQLGTQFKEVRKNAEAFEKTQKAEKKANESAGSKEEFENALGGALGPTGPSLSE